jgi:hypothetical protein
MLDGMIQTLNAGQTPSGGTQDQSQQGQNQQADAGAADGEAAIINNVAATGEVLVPVSDTSPAAAAALPSLADAITFTTGFAAKTASAPVAANPVAASDAALAALAVQAGVVPVATATAAPASNAIAQSASTTAPVAATTNANVPLIAGTVAAQTGTADALAIMPAVAADPAVDANNVSALPASPTLSLAASTAPQANVPTGVNQAGTNQDGTLTSAVTAVVASDTIAVTPTISITASTAKPAATKSDQDNSDSQQSAILAALFAQAPQTIGPVAAVSIADASASKGSSPVSGVSTAGPASVPGVGIPPTLSPPAFVGNGNQIANPQTVAAPIADPTTSGGTPATVHAPLAFGIGAVSTSDTADSSADSYGESPTASPQVSTDQVTSDQNRAEAISALFAEPEPKAAKSTVADTAVAPSVGNVAPSTDTGTAGLTFLHQASTVAATATTATATGVSASAYTSPAEQVSLVIGRAVSVGTQSMTIALNPLELGKVQVKLDIAKDGSVQASVTAERADTLTLLKNDHSMLSQALHNAGLTTTSTSLSFNLRDGSNSSQQQQGFGSASSYRSPVNATAADDAVSSSSTNVQYAVTSDNGRLNVIV